MKFSIIVLVVAALSSPTYANYSSDHPKSGSASSVDSRKAGTQEYIDTARTGQSAAKRVYFTDTKACRDADGVWLKPGDVGHETCVKAAKAVNKIK